MGEDIELQSLENLLEKLLPSIDRFFLAVELEKPYTLFKRYMRVEENKHTQKVVFKSSIPWHAKVPWDYTSFPGMADLYSKAKAGIFYRYRYEDFDFKGLLEYSFSRIVLKTKVGFSKYGGEIGITQSSSLAKTPEYLDLFCRYSRKNVNSRVNFLYIPEVSGLILTSSAVATRYIIDLKRPGKIQPQLFGGEISLEPVPFRLLRTILLHQTHFDKGKLTFAYVRKEAADKTFSHKLMTGFTMDLQNKRSILSCMTFDLRLNRAVVNLVYTKPYAEKKGSLVRYKISSEGRIGTDVIVRKKNALVGWNFEVNLLPLTQHDNFGLLKFGVRLENVYERLFSDTL